MSVLYICIWGTSPKERVTDWAGVEMECPSCQRTTTMVGKAVTPYCTIFWIPLCPEGGGEEFFECSLCGAKFQGSVDELRHRISAARSELQEKIKQVEARFAADPGNVDDARELVELYMADERGDDALTIAENLSRTHPEDPNFLVLLGRIYLAKERQGDAVEAFDRAIHQNPQHAGAHFFKAVSLLQYSPPNLASALEAAKEAHQCGYPDALGLVRSIEEAIRKQA